ncbi:phage minor tail protein L [Moraxella osloensis]|nr:phage minor tail protein L [Moraxella osloensis]MBW4008555.1 phage minor tail protein L [Moraxella osloensis]
MLNSDFQKLSVAGIVTLYQLDATRLGGGVFYWHGHVTWEDWARILDYAGDSSLIDNNQLAGHDYDISSTDKEVKRDIIWQGQAYSPVAIKSDGLELRGDGKASMPNLAIANTLNGINGAMSALCLQLSDFAGAKLTVITTLAKYLDAANFASGNPQARNEYKKQVWFVEQKTAENASQVTFELSNPVDFEGMKIPCREITNYCHWAVCGRYRQDPCLYSGSAMFTKDGKPTDNPSLDYCGGSLADCKLRDNTARFGGFPSSSLD